jgi:micrococcal nuclease
MAHGFDMKTKRVTIGFLAVLVFLFAPATVFAQNWHTVRGVIDGDTVILKNGRTVRYIGINAPEIEHKNRKGEPFGIFSSRTNRKLVQGQKVRLEKDHETHDRYGRQLAYVFLADGTFVNATLVQVGAAYCLPHSLNAKYKDTFQRAQRRAMATGRGIWQNWTKRPEKLLGNKNSGRFHCLTCPFGKKIGNRNRVYFPNRWDAFEAGFAPCKKCIKQFRD